jgi:hypothetical protein
VVECDRACPLGIWRIDYYSEILRRLRVDPEFGPFFERQATRIPQFYVDRIQKDLGPLWNWLPEGSLEHDPNAYLKSTIRVTTKPVEATLAV